MGPNPKIIELRCFGFSTRLLVNKHNAKYLFSLKKSKIQSVSVNVFVVGEGGGAKSDTLPSIGSNF